MFPTKKELEKIKSLTARKNAVTTFFYLDAAVLYSCEDNIIPENARQKILKNIEPRVNAYLVKHFPQDYPDLRPVA